MVQNYSVKYMETPSGYMGQVVEWPEVISEGKTLTECRESVEDALREMVLAYRQLGKEVPSTHPTANN